MQKKYWRYPLKDIWHKMMKGSWVGIGILSIIIGFYPIYYIVLGDQFGLLTSKPSELLQDPIWNIAFYGHIVPGGIALLIGWLQFNHKWRVNNIRFHRTVGKIYMISVLISGFCGLYIAVYATGGMVCILGFASLAIIWLTTTIFAFFAIKRGDAGLHAKLMTYSYAACFGAVTLRIWLPVLTELSGEFIKAYRIVAWISWVPNLLFAYFLLKRNKTPDKRIVYSDVSAE